MRIKRFLSRHGLKPIDVGISLAALCATMTVAGCSADVSRFDFPSFSLNGDADTTASLQNDGDVGGARLADQSPSAGGYGNNSSYGSGNDTSYSAPRDRAADRVEVARLPDRTPASEPSRSRASYAPSAATPVQPTGGYGASTGRGEKIRVVSGDTLYGLSRQHGVSVSELMAVNNLTSPALSIGQTLYMPQGARSQTAGRDDDYAAPDLGSDQPTTISSSEVPTNWNGSYTVAQGDSLYRVSKQYGVSIPELQRYNNITDPRRMRPGLVLRVPGSGSASDGQRVAAFSQQEMAPSAAAERGRAEPARPTPRVIQSTTKPTVINGAGAQQQAALPSVRVEPPKSAVGDTAKLRWPVRGKVIAGFGRRDDGTHNDGINMLVPAGTDVHAADSGVVAYAGSELKGYGNLILIRHDNGWVTAYAHNEAMLVKRGAKVQRGEVIAKAGKTGQVDEPQLHFELRKGSKPVDPMPYLASTS